MVTCRQTLISVHNIHPIEIINLKPFMLESPQDEGPNVETVPEDEEDDDGSSAGVTAPSRPVQNRVLTKRFEASMTGQYHGFSNLQVLGDQPGDYIEYTEELAPVVAHILLEIKNRITSTVTKDVHGSNFHVLGSSS